MNRYSTYKDSGIEWIGDIPKEWRLKKLKYISRVNSLSLSETTNEDYEFNYIDIGNVNIEKGFNLGEKIRFETAPSRARRIVKKGNTIVSTVRTYLKAIAYIGDDVEDVIVSTGFAVINPNKEIEPKFLYYLLRSEKFIDRICALSVGVSYPAINSSELSSIVAWFPNKDDQNKISAYLDRKSESIEKLIVKKERMIELLKEERTAIINQAVTKGLNPEVKMKESGIEWLDKIPKHWEIKKLKFNTYVRFSNVDKKSEEGEIAVRLCNYVDVYYNDFITLNLEFMTATASIEEIRKFQLNIGDVIVTKDSESWDDIAIPAYVLETENKLICGYHLAQIRSDSRVLNGKFLFWMLSGNSFNYQFKIEATGITRYGLSNYGLSNSLIVLPPVEEQDEIGKYLEQKTKQLAGQIEREQKSIELLKEYRTSLISEVVTGKIDVRN